MLIGIVVDQPSQADFPDKNCAVVGIHHLPIAYQQRSDAIVAFNQVGRKRDMRAEKGVFCQADRAGRHRIKAVHLPDADDRFHELIRAGGRQLLGRGSKNPFNADSVTVVFRFGQDVFQGSGRCNGIE